MPVWDTSKWRDFINIDMDKFFLDTMPQIFIGMILYKYILYYFHFNHMCLHIVFFSKKKIDHKRTLYV